MKASEIEEKLNSELSKRRNIERQLIILNEQVRNQKQIDHLKHLSNFIQTRYANNLFIFYSGRLSVFWLPARHNDKTQDLLKKTQDQ